MYRHLAGERRRAKDRGVIFFHGLPDEVPNVFLRLGKVDVTTPDPLVLRLLFDQRAWLGVVDINDIGAGIDGL